MDTLFCFDLDFTHMEGPGREELVLREVEDH